MNNSFLVKINAKHETQLEYLKMIESRLQENGYDFIVEETDVEVCEYYIDGELYLENNFLDENGIVAFLTSKQEHQCTGCGAGCSH